MSEDQIDKKINESAHLRQMGIETKSCICLRKSNLIISTHNGLK